MVKKYWQHTKHTNTSTSWGSVGKWYGELVGTKGHYYHEHVVLPKVLKLIKDGPKDQQRKVLDLGCGNGVLAQYLPKEAIYVGVDIAGALIKIAKSLDRNPNHTYIVSDVTKPLRNIPNDYTHAVMILALQNMENAESAIGQACEHLQEGGKLIVVINHPCFRIPRQSGWGINEQSKTQYRWVNRYMSQLKIPITMHPGQRQGPVTWSFHEPLSNYIQYMKTNRMLVENIEEWVSDKKSTGAVGKMENLSRDEIPMFMAIVGIKTTNYSPGR